MLYEVKQSKNHSVGGNDYKEKNKRVRDKNSQFGNKSWLAVIINYDITIKVT